MASPINSLVAAGLTPEELKHFTRRRSRKAVTISPYKNVSNAGTVKPYLDALLADPENGIFVPASQNNISASTLHQKFNAGLAFLCDQPSPAFANYRALRAVVVFEQRADGVILRTKPGFNFVSPIKPSETHDKIGWKKELYDFVETATVRPSEHKIKDAFLKDEDVEFLAQFARQIPGCSVTYQGKDVYVRLQ